jgi:DNA modification methylase
MTESVKGKHGICYFTDCIEGMKTIIKQKFSLCCTDPPYNCNVHRNDKINYVDTFEEEKYKIFCKEWFTLARKISQDLLFTPGVLNEFYYPKPDWMECWFHAGSTSHTLMGGFSHWQPILVYSEKVIRDVDAISLPDIANHFVNCDHPTLKPVKLWEWIFKRYKPTSVIDPFIGSGTTAQVCESLGIPWTGFEIKAEYKESIAQRIKLGETIFKRRQRVKKISKY